MKGFQDRPTKQILKAILMAHDIASDLLKDIAMPTGGCLCSQLKYEYSGEPVMKAICQCITCRHVSGSVFTTNIVVPEGNFKVTVGTPKTYATTQDSGMTLTYSFCANCGNVISKVGDAEGFPGVILILAGSLDNVSGVETAEPGVEFYVSKRASWLPELIGKGQMQDFS
ncbi:uncharacterized protein Z519_12702 [Cladophialophora bantiana CBS 173.52]|uniref:CENP-V/GFA domain-containing protein n=1 Tax=Cladophialophora bantiana (strain ATCC 10958 / CBS 173.52 / CDC B-1940 / NIH 8579) TaxID=1442370 RepID=A0A0D2E9A8_CLAB1|nr:uncharacterized protein Z519_12702 [Cladophialophora bantiana CBS 173.52]KIW86716.1 hypothetical protein Z519_12702 [Cladophialophora bantiana CBS 173.52]